jgi:hypothetical protein
MFFPISSCKKSPSVKNAFSLVFVLFLITGAAFFPGCKTEDEDTGNLVGTWKSSFDETWTITAAAVKTATFEGTIKNNPNFEAPAGVIIIEYTKKPEYYDYGPAPDYTKTGPFDPPGNFYAIYWKSLTAASIELSNAWDIKDFSHNGAPETTSLEAAIAKFTMDDVVKYVGTYSVCAKQ